AGTERRSRSCAGARGLTGKHRGARCAAFVSCRSMKSKSRRVERRFPFLRLNERESKPRKRGLAEIRGPYYAAYGRRHLEDLFETMGRYIDSLKFAGGSFTL